ncbi:MAG: hypothetical protein LUE29_06300 [Lachnospiraceae bacterium]|nr:hypothetical protein [Lachnospiraceae bacterium]
MKSILFEMNHDRVYGYGSSQREYRYEYKEQLRVVKCGEETAPEERYVAEQLPAEEYMVEQDTSDTPPD